MSESNQRPLVSKLARIIRIATVPPVMVAILLILLYFFRSDIFGTTAEKVISVLFLAIFPALAYPVSVAIPALRRKGREGQRSLAIYVSSASYVILFVYGLVAGVGKDLMAIYTGYVLSVVIILVSNKLLRIRVSGHACSVSGPLVYTAYFLGAWGIVAGAVMWCVILWASLVLKRHTVKEFLLGTVTCLVSFAVALILFH